MSKVVYAGSFDPITSGHLWVMRQGSRAFDHLVVAIGINPDKKGMFSQDERLAMIRESLEIELAAGRVRPNVTVEVFDNKFLAYYVKKIGADIILRGIRNETDYQFERGMRYVNEELNPEAITMLVMPPRESTEISSSFVKGLIGPEGWEQIVQKYVPTPVFERLLQRARSKAHEH